MEETPTAPGFWDKIQAISTGLEQVAGKIRSISYNALDFLSGDYCSRESTSLPKLVSGLTAWTTESGNHHVITLETVKGPLSKPDLTAKLIADHFGYLKIGVHRREREYRAAGPYVSNQDRAWGQDQARIESEHDRERMEILEEAQKQCDQWGSIEVISYIRGRGVARRVPYSPEQASAEDCLEYAKLPLERRISYSDIGLSAEWLADPSQGEFDGQTIPFERADEIFFSIKKMLADPRCQTPAKVAQRAKPRRKVERKARSRATIRFDEMQDGILAKPRPATLRVQIGRDWSPSQLTQNQLFYLTAFLFCGVKSRRDKIGWSVVEESTLAARLISWRKAGIRGKGDRPSEGPEHRILKEWPRFAKQMNDRADTSDWFELVPHKDADSKRCYRQRTDELALGIDSTQGDWLRELLRKLTGRS